MSGYLKSSYPLKNISKPNKKKNINKVADDAFENSKVKKVIYSVNFSTRWTIRYETFQNFYFQIFFSCYDNVLYDFSSG